MDEGIKAFQRDKNLKIDGIMKPGGETERGLFESLTGRKADDIFGRADNDRGAVGFGGNVSGTFAPQPQKSKQPQNPLIFSTTPMEKNEKGLDDKYALYLKDEDKEPEKRQENFENKPAEYDATGRMIKTEKETSSSIPPIPERKPAFNSTVKIPKYSADQAFDGFRKNLEPREGGVANRQSKADPGGLTNKGMSQKALDDLRKAHPQWNLPAKPTQLTDQQITDLFRHEYYERPQIGKLNSIASSQKTGSKLVEHVFDANITTNPLEVGKWLQEAIDETVGTDLRITRGNGKKEYDGIMGSQTRAALQKAVAQGKTKDINTKFSDKRIQYLRTLPNYPGNPGWEDRVKNLRD